VLNYLKYNKVLISFYFYNIVKIISDIILEEVVAIKVAINGFGRIGRSIARVISTRDDMELVAINDISSSDMMAYLFKHDSVHGVLDNDIKIDDGYLIYADNIKAKISHHNHPNDIDFASLDVDVVLECTGKFLTTDEVKSHIDKGCKKVILSAPSNDNTPTFVIGVNFDDYSGEDIISNASCTTNCLGQITKIIEDNIGIKKGLMTTIHSYTSNQSILDIDISKDKRRNRAAGVNMIPTTTGAAKAMHRVMPSLKGKLHGQSVRVPTPNVSMVDLNLSLARDTDIDEINNLFIKASRDTLKGILDIDDEMKVSSDILGNSHSCIVATDLTQVIDGDMAKIMAWYDNEWGYSNRIVDMARYIISWSQK
jgi:glyceraldehyde 3-phosphate dehydrogenase